MSDQVAAVCRALATISCGSCARSYGRYRYMAPRQLSMPSFRLDYCNSLLPRVNDGLLQRLQSVQNAAARLVTGTRRCEHITPVLRQLHWLPVRQRIRYKLAMLVFRALSGQAPDYLVDDYQLVADSGRRTLTSTERWVRLVPCCNTTFGDRSFGVAGPREFGTTCQPNSATLDRQSKLFANI